MSSTRWRQRHCRHAAERDTPPCPRSVRSPCSPRPCRAPPAPAEPGDAAPVPPRDQRRPDKHRPRPYPCSPTGSHGHRLVLPPLSPLSAIKRAPRWKEGSHHHHTRATARAPSSAPSPPLLPRHGRRIARARRRIAVAWSLPEQIEDRQSLRLVVLFLLIDGIASGRRRSTEPSPSSPRTVRLRRAEIGRASCRERV